MNESVHQKACRRKARPIRYASCPSIDGQNNPMPIARKTISIHCSCCRALLYRYRKGGSGGLVKCFVERIAEDHTAGDLHCPGCGQQFARDLTIAGKPAHKIIQGKVFTRGMRRK